MSIYTQYETIDTYIVVLVISIVFVEQLVLIVIPRAVVIVLLMVNYNL